ncbi:glycoside hydrolase family 2 protein [Candidatus Hydrogenedentota bacterium]
MILPRPEHPRPQFRRDKWINLNGEWTFQFDFCRAGVEKGLPYAVDGFGDSIIVPFCAESALSGVGYTDFIPAIWYHRKFEIPGEWNGDRIFLHFGAVDYDCRVWVNGTAVGRHYGGNSSFSVEITGALRDGENDLVVCAQDDVRSGLQPAGKQSEKLHSYGVRYTRTTGIWQTVWLEAVPDTRIESCRITPDLDGSSFVLTPVINGCRQGMRLEATLLADDTEKTRIRVSVSPGVPVTLDVEDPRPWSCSDPFLYDLRLSLICEDEVVDSVQSYCGLRKFHIEANRFYLNNSPIFLRFVLDQGFYPDGIWTAPSDSELRADIERSMSLGFNGARLHQKVFEERFHYWADKLGYLTWGEFCDWGMDFGLPEAIHNHQREWREVIIRDANHPSIVAWTPFNETYRAARDHFEEHRRALEEIYDLTKALDPARPVNDASGYCHVKTDIYTVHDYEQDPAQFRERFASVSEMNPDEAFVRFPELSCKYKGQPYVVDEYGGTWWADGPLLPEYEQDADRIRKQDRFPSTKEKVYDAIEKLTAVLTDHPQIAGYTYTQLTDVEQEVNGLYTYDRKLKFDAERLREAFSAPAAIE